MNLQRSVHENCKKKETETNKIEWIYLKNKELRIIWFFIIISN